MTLYMAMHIGLGMETAMAMPSSMLYDMLATWQIMECGYNRVPTSEKDIEDDFIKTMSWR